MRLIVNKYRFEMIDARKRKRYRTRQFHIRKSINKIYIYIKRNTKIRCNDRAKERVESKNDPLILANEFTVATISQSSGETFRPCITRRRKMDSAPSHGRHEFIITITSRRSYLIAEVAIRIYLAICRDCLQIGGFLHVLLSFFVLTRKWIKVTRSWRD